MLQSQNFNCLGSPIYTLFLRCSPNFVSTAHFQIIQFRIMQTLTKPFEEFTFSIVSQTTKNIAQSNNHPSIVLSRRQLRAVGRPAALGTRRVLIERNTISDLPLRVCDLQFESIESLLKSASFQSLVHVISAKKYELD